AFSYLFYGWVKIWYVPLILWMTVVDFCAGNLIGGHWNWIGKPAVSTSGDRTASVLQRRLFLALSLCNSLGMLFFFKYLIFAQENINWISKWLGRPGVTLMEIALPA